MSFKYINDYYGLSVRRGTKLKYRGKLCTVISSKGQYLNVKDADGKRLGPLHPTHEIEYL